MEIILLIFHNLNSDIKEEISINKSTKEKENEFSFDNDNTNNFNLLSPITPINPINENDKKDINNNLEENYIASDNTTNKLNGNILDGSKNSFPFNFPKFPENISEISSKMSEPQRKEYEDLIKRTQFFSEMYKLMSDRMAQSQQIVPTNLFKDFNENQNQRNANNNNNSQGNSDKDKIINSKTFIPDNHIMKFTSAINNNKDNMMINNNISNTEQKVKGISNKNNSFLNSYYKTPNKNESNSFFNNKNNNLSNNKIYSIIDTTSNKNNNNGNNNNNNNKQNYEGISKVNNNILQDPNQNKFLDDLFD